MEKSTILIISLLSIWSILGFWIGRYTNIKSDIVWWKAWTVLFISGPILFTLCCVPLLLQQLNDGLYDLAKVIDIWANKEKQSKL